MFDYRNAFVVLYKKVDVDDVVMMMKSSFVNPHHFDKIYLQSFDIPAPF